MSKHRDHASGSRSNHDHERYKRPHNEEPVFIKPEPLEHTHHHSPSRERSRSRSYSDKSSRNDRRFRDPVVIKPEEHRKRRLHSPVVLRDDRPSRHGESRARRRGEDTDGGERSSGENLQRSGLLDKDEAAAPVVKQRTNFGLSGKLTADTNTYKGVVIKYNEPEDARKPTSHWRLYAFKGDKSLNILHIHRQSGFLIGRDRKIADIPMDHPSISKQHAVLQYRFVRGLVRLYVIDLESPNGTFLNHKQVEPRRYYELLEKDVIKFGFSSREYVVMTSLPEDEEDDEEEDEETTANR